MKAVQKGAGDNLGGTGLVVALGLSLGAMLGVSNGAASLAAWAMRFVGAPFAPYASLVVALVIGLPLFFETGLVLLLPIVAAAATAITGPRDDAGKLRLLLPALTGLSIVHALVPPHPGPLLAVNALHADLARTICYGLLVAIPTGLIAGPLLSRYTARGVAIALPGFEATNSPLPAPRKRATLTVVLMPVVLISLGQVVALMPAATRHAFCVDEHGVRARAGICCSPISWRCRCCSARGCSKARCRRASGAMHWHRLARSCCRSARAVH